MILLRHIHLFAVDELLLNVTSLNLTGRLQGN